jgi:hypothetical protein
MIAGNCTCFEQRRTMGLRSNRCTASDCIKVPPGISIWILAGPSVGAVLPLLIDQPKEDFDHGYVH